MSTEAQVRRLEKLGQEVIVHYKRKGDVAEYSRYKNDPLGFMVEVLHADPWRVQREIAELVRDHPRVVVRSANSMGKGWLAVRLALWWTYSVGGLVVMTSATLRQLRIGAMRELRMAFARTDLPGTLYEESLRIGDRSGGIYAYTASDSSAWQGIHHEHLLIIIDEATGVESEIFEAAVACVPERTLVLGNPLRPSGDFYRINQSDNWRSVAISAAQHPNIVENRLVIPGGPTAEWVQTMYAEYGRDSSVVRARVEGEFPEQSIEGLVTRAQLNRAFDRHESGELAEQGFSPYVLGLDVGHRGPDKSCCAVIRGSVVEELITWQGLTLEQSADKIMEIGKELRDRLYHPRRNPNPSLPTCWVDAPGLGIGAYEFLKKGRYPARDYWGSHSPIGYEKKDVYLNLRSQSFFHFRECLENDRIALPRDEDLAEEALSAEWFTNSAGRIQITAKKDMKSTLGRSPDMLDSVVIGLSMSGGVGYSPMRVGNVSIGHGGMQISWH